MMNLSPVRFGGIGMTSVFKGKPAKMERFADLLYSAQYDLKDKEEATLDAIAQHNKLVRPFHLAVADQFVNLVRAAAAESAPPSPDHFAVHRTKTGDLIVSSDRDNFFMNVLLSSYIHKFFPAIQDDEFSFEEVHTALNELLQSVTGLPQKFFGNADYIEDTAVRVYEETP
jgi:hypothetical protein